MTGVAGCLASGRNEQPLICTKSCNQSRMLRYFRIKHKPFWHAMIDEGLRRGRTITCGSGPLFFRLFVVGASWGVETARQKADFYHHVDTVLRVKYTSWRNKQRVQGYRVHASFARTCIRGGYLRLTPSLTKHAYVWSQPSA